MQNLDYLLCIFSSAEKPNPRWFRSHALDVRVILLHISPSRRNMGKKFSLSSYIIPSHHGASVPLRR